MFIDPKLSQKPETQSVVAVHAYKAERDNELSMQPGEHFRFVKREPGWYVVEKNGRNYYIPAHSVMEAPVSKDGPESPSSPPFQKGTALVDFTRTSPNQVSVRKGEVFVVEKKFTHWSLVEINGQRGWVPTNVIQVESDK